MKLEFAAVTFAIKMAAVRENTLLMLKRRGYSETVLELADTYLRLPEALVIFVSDAKVSVGHMKNILGLRVNDEKIIIVHEKSITSEARNTIASAKNIETFTYDEMGYDLLEIAPMHSKVDGPKHKDYKLFPVLQYSDIARRYFDFKRGDVVKIVEDDGTIVYRTVI